MSIVKKNEYSTTNNLSSMSINIDLNRLRDDKTFIEVNSGTSPATITIKVGSVIEANGSAYTVETADYVFQASDTTHAFIGFDGTTFTSQLIKGTLDPEKQGYYQVDNLTRTLKWMIDGDSGNFEEIAMFEAEKTSDSTGMSEGGFMGYTTNYTVPGGLVVGLKSSGARFQAPKDGLYSFHVEQSFSNSAITPGVAWSLRIGLRFEPSSTNVLVASSELIGSVGPDGPFLGTLNHNIYLLSGEEVEVQTVNVTNGTDIIRLAHDPPVYESGIFYGNEVIGKSLI